MHTPPSRHHYSYLPCLRWEFGFTCIFCLLHETDYAWHGIRRSGIFWIEHYFLQSEYPARVQDYSNCFYSCRFCNRARGRTPAISADGVRLVNPNETSLNEHFRVLVDTIEGTTPDGGYSEKVYDLNDPRKKMLRRNRTAKIDELVDLFKSGPRLLRALLATTESKRPGRNQALRDLRTALRAAFREARKWRPIPHDCDDLCACGAPRRLPDWLDAQCIRMEIDASAQESPKDHSEEPPFP